MEKQIFDQEAFLEIEVLRDGSAELDAPAECTCSPKPDPDPPPACCNSNVAVA